MKKRPEATDYLNTSHPQKVLEWVRMKVVEGMGANPNPAKLQSAIQREQAAMREAMMLDLPDRYLSPEEMTDRQERIVPQETIPELG